MTTLNLACRSGHTFEVWFRSAAEFSRQQAARLVACPWCGERDIERRPSVPNVMRSRDKTADTMAMAAKMAAKMAASGEKISPSSSAETDAEMALMPSSSMRSFARMLRAFHHHIEKTCENVGDHFAEEARRMHEERETEEKSCEGRAIENKNKSKDKRKQGIYGHATAEEVHSLTEDGIAISALPPLPNRHN